MGNLKHSGLNEIWCDIDQRNYSLQLGIGRSSKDLEFGASLKLLNHQREINSFDVPTKIKSISIYRQVMDTEESLMLEPGIFVRMGLKYLKIQYQMNFVRNMTNTKYPSSNYSHGLSIIFKPTDLIKELK